MIEGRRNKGGDEGRGQRERRERKARRRESNLDVHSIQSKYSIKGYVSEQAQAVIRQLHKEKNLAIGPRTKKMDFDFYWSRR